MAMLVLLLLAAQTVPGPPGDTDGVTLTQSCNPGPDEIVVCARDNEQFRARPVGPAPGQPAGPPRAAVRLPGGGEASAGAEGAGPSGAFTRIVVGVKVPF